MLRLPAERSSSSPASWMRPATRTWGISIGPGIAGGRLLVIRTQQLAGRRDAVACRGREQAHIVGDGDEVKAPADRLGSIFRRARMKTGALAGFVRLVEDGVDGLEHFRLFAVEACPVLAAS